MTHYTLTDWRLLLVLFAPPRYVAAWLLSRGQSRFQSSRALFSGPRQGLFSETSAPSEAKPGVILTIKAGCFNQTKTKTTELVIARAGPVEKSIELTTYPMQQEPEDTYD
jgi:hypothetical protein